MPSLSPLACTTLRPELEAAQLLCLILPSSEQEALKPVQKMLINLQPVSSLCARKKDFPDPPLTGPAEGGAN